MSKAVLIMDMPESCLRCPLVDGDNKCIMQDEDANSYAYTWDKLEGCPLQELPEWAIDAIISEKPEKPDWRQQVMSRFERVR